jgi:hypothetical protein
MDILYHMLRWLKGLDYGELLVYVGMPAVLLILLVGWFRDLCRSSR